MCPVEIFNGRRLTSGEVVDFPDQGLTVSEDAVEVLGRDGGTEDYETHPQTGGLVLGNGASKGLHRLLSVEELFLVERGMYNGVVGVERIIDYRKIWDEGSRWRWKMPDGQERRWP